VCQGGLRFELHDVLPGPYGVWQGQVTYLPQDPMTPLPAEWQLHADRLGQWIASAQQQGVENKLPLFAPYQLDDCGWLANRLAEVLPLEPEQKQRLLAQTDPHQRMASVVEFLTQA